MVNKIIKNGTTIFTKKQNNILSAAVVIMAMTFTSRVLGLFRDRYLASTFFIDGHQWQLDVYNAAFRLPDMVFQMLVLGALSAAFIPVYSKYLTKNEQKANQMAQTIITIFGLLFFVAGVLVFIFAPQLSHLIAPDFSFAKIELMVSLTRIMLFAQLLFLVSSFYSGILQSYQRFLIPAISPILYNLGIIFGTLYLSQFYGIYGAAYGVVIGALGHLLIQIPLARKLGFYYRPRFNFSAVEVRQIFKLMIPRTFGLAINQIELTLAIYFGSSFTDGSLSIFYLAQRLGALPVGIFGMAIGQAAFPMLSKEDEFGKKFKQIFLYSFKQIMYFVLPASVLLLVLRVPLVRIAYGTKSFPWEATILTGQVVAVFSTAILAQSITQLLIRSFYALEDTVTPLWVGVISMITNVLFAFIFVHNLDYGVIGLAMAISISSLIQVLFLLFLIQKRIGFFTITEYIMPFIKMILASFIMGVALWVPMQFLDKFILDTTKVIELIILTIVATASGFLVYLILSSILQIEELNKVLNIFKKFGAWKKILSESEESIGGVASTQLVGGED